jgi:molybdate transport system substrate-binding protein
MGFLAQLFYMKHNQFLWFVIAVLVSFVLGLSLQMSNPELAYANTNLLVSAASSLRDGMEEVKPLYPKTHPNISLTFNFGASGALLQQIEQGAPVDVFISAAKGQMDALEKQQALVAGTRTNLASNRLALIVPRDSKAVINFMSLKNPAVKRISMGEPRSVPAGQYAAQVLQKQNLFNSVKPKLVYANNVRQVLSVVASGNADAGIVYITDAKTSEAVKVIAIADDSMHSPIVYPMAVLKNSKNVSAAKAFVQYLSGNEVKGLLRKYGFVS